MTTQKLISKKVFCTLHCIQIVSCERFGIFGLTMVFKGALSAEERAYIVYLVHDKNVSVKDIRSKTGVSAATIYRLKQTKIGGQKHCTWTPIKHPGGRPKKLTARDERHLLRCIPVLREEEGNFCAKRLMQRAGLSKKKVSDRTVRRCLNENGYYYLQARKKGLMTKKSLFISMV